MALLKPACWREMLGPVGRQKSDVHPDRRVVIGLANAGLWTTLLDQWSVKGAVGGLVAGAVCVTGYLGWLYGRDRYERWVVDRHAYRPKDR